MDKNSYIAATRFGMGVTPGEVERVASSPKNWLLAQIREAEPNSRDFAKLASAQENAAKLIEARQQAKDSDNKDLVKEIRRGFKDVYIDEMRAKLAHAMTTPTPFYERLVDFWSNHFTVSVKKPATAGLDGAFEREAIRPYVTGRFVDMLVAVERHPAMQLYLDNAQSIGPDSMAGKRMDKGLNENLAREIMELHTVGVNGGYTQTDVTNFAKVLTGWSIGTGKQGGGEPGQFFFAERRHEPGAEVILGRNYRDEGEKQGLKVLNDLAVHPATARHLATKLAKHFIADEPPESAIKAIAASFRDFGGDLKAVYRTIIDLPEAWSTDQPKIKSSYDLVVSAVRLCGIHEDMMGWCLQSLKFLGDVPFTANSPAGFSDLAKDIGGPEAILRRVEWAQGAAGKLAGTTSYKELTTLAIGPVMEAHTLEVLDSAHNEREGLALLLGSPEFQRR